MRFQVKMRVDTYLSARSSSSFQRCPQKNTARLRHTITVNLPNSMWCCAQAADGLSLASAVCRLGFVLVSFLGEVVFLLCYVAAGEKRLRRAETLTAD